MIKRMEREVGIVALLADLEEGWGWSLFEQKLFILKICDIF
jgi:hypothetical protein